MDTRRCALTSFSSLTTASTRPPCRATATLWCTSCTVSDGCCQRRCHRVSQLCATCRRYRYGRLPLFDTDSRLMKKKTGDPSGFSKLFLLVQTDGNLVLYQDVAVPNCMRWHTDTHNKHRGGPFRLVMQNDGNLVLCESPKSGCMLLASSCCCANALMMHDTGQMTRPGRYLRPARTTLRTSMACACAPRSTRTSAKQFTTLPPTTSVSAPRFCPASSVSPSPKGVWVSSTWCARCKA